MPVAVLLGARAAHRLPSGRVLIGAALSVGGTAAFVLLSNTGRSTTPTSSPTWLGLLVAVGVMGGTVVVFSLAARYGSLVIRGLAYAGAGAVCFGFSSAVLRLIARAIGVGGLSTLVIVAGLAAAVVASLTVGDPLVGILLSAGLLGEGLVQGFGAVVAVVGCGAAATAGVWLLTRHYPVIGSASDRATTRVRIDSNPHPDPAAHSQLHVIGDRI